jgi:hypothetical protein
MAELQLQLNGKRLTVDVDPATPLLFGDDTTGTSRIEPFVEFGHHSETVS